MIALRSLLNGSVGTRESVVEEAVHLFTSAHLVLVVVVFVYVPRYQRGRERLALEAGNTVARRAEVVRGRGVRVEERTHLHDEARIELRVVVLVVVATARLEDRLRDCHRIVVQG